MAIPVTCPGCLKRFNVSEKFAGKTGPCPNCQKQIKIPDRSEQVVIHSPEDMGAKDAKGKLVLKPIRRKEVKLSVPVILAASLSAVVVLGIALGLGLSGEQPPAALLWISAVGLAVPLVCLGYWFLQEDELDGFHGRELLVRAGICALGFAATWAVYGFVPRYVSGYESMAEFSGLDLVIFIPVMLLLGTLISIAALELEALAGFMHYILYFTATFFLAWLAGAHLAAPLSDAPSPVPQQSAPAVVQPAKPNAPVAPATDAQTPTPEKPIPNLLQ